MKGMRSDDKKQTDEGRGEHFRLIKNQRERERVTKRN